MAKKEKKGGKKLKRFLPVLLVLGGAALAIYGRDWLSNFIDEFVAGIGFKVRKVRLKFRNVTNIDITLESTITNKNPIGGTATAFDGKLTFGIGGPLLTTLSLPAPIQLPANGSVDANILATVNLFTLGASVQAIVSQIQAGTFRKLWLEGTLKTSFAALPISSEVTIFQE